jgi:DNA-binding response OmpR family regulator
MNQDLILIVDDEPKLVRLVTEVLRATGYHVISSSNGEQAIELVSIEQPDLVILDIVLLGNLDGFTVAKRLREFSNIPIIMLTAKVRESDMLRGYECGIDDYMMFLRSALNLLCK